MIAPRAFASALVLGVTLAVTSARAQDAGVTLPGDAGFVWRDFLARQDLRWNELPSDWWSGAFTGNGGLGAMVYHDVTQGLRFEVGHTAVWDHQETPGSGLGGMRAGKTRLMIGGLFLVPAGEIRTGSMRLDLWNAEVTGSAETSRGTLRWRTFTYTHEDIQLVELWTTGEESGAAWRFVPAPARSPWGNEPPTVNPAPVVSERDDLHVTDQSLVAGGGFATAWRELRLTPDHRVLVLGVAYDTTGHDYVTRANDLVTRGHATGISALEARHRAWWNDYFPRSFLAVPDASLTRFYWVQMYKLASATRAERPVYDLLGPWVRPTRWPGLWWNLNVQMVYWPVYTANRLDLGESLSRALDRALTSGALAENDPVPAYRAQSAAIATTSTPDLRSAYPLVEHCNLTWALHNDWWQYRYTMDPAFLRERLVPLLRRAVGYYLQRLTDAPVAGRLNIPVGRSPEYDVMGPNPTVDVALLRWALDVLLDADARLGLNDPMRAQWMSARERLVDLPSDETGLLIATGVRQEHPHREPAHLLAIHPLHLLDWDVPSQRTLIETSVERWTRGPGTGLVPAADDRSGFSFAWAASLHATMLRGDDALTFLRATFDRLAPGTEITPNTFYRDTEHATSETPMGVAAALQDMLIQSWGDRIRVFPALPSAWRDVGFAHLRTEGAFLVTARREGGVTRSVTIESLAGSECRVESDLPWPWEAVGARPFTLDRDARGVVTIDLRRGETVTLRARTTPDAGVFDSGIDAPRVRGEARGGCSCAVAARRREPWRELVALVLALLTAVLRRYGRQAMRSTARSTRPPAGTPSA